MIKVEDLHMHFGGIHAVDGISLSFETGKITGLIGPNGAGKSSLMRTLATLQEADSGSAQAN